MKLTDRCSAIVVVAQHFAIEERVDKVAWDVIDAIVVLELALVFAFQTQSLVRIGKSPFVEDKR